MTFLIINDIIISKGGDILNTELQESINNVIKALETQKQFKGDTDIDIHENLLYDNQINNIKIKCNCNINTNCFYPLVDILSSLDIINYKDNLSFNSVNLKVDKQNINNTIDKLNDYIKTNSNRTIGLKDLISKTIKQNYHDLQNFKIIKITIPRVNESDYNDTINKFKTYQFKLSKDMTKLYIHRKLE